MKIKPEFTVAIFSNNEKKYSETFIHSQYFHLPFKKIIYSGGYTPTVISYDNSKSFKKIQGFWSTKPSKKAILQSLKKNKVDVILINYGTTAVSCLSILKESKIPFIVHFHGYDAYRTEILQTYGLQYEHLFSAAQSILVVSEHMKKQLIKLKCPMNKIQEANYGVNDIYNQKIEKEINSEKIIACGRFVEKKGHLFLIEAFSLYRKKFQNAQLILIGDGTLKKEYEIKCKALNLEDAVKFKGVLSKEEILSEYLERPIFVQCSVRPDSGDMEGLPLSMLEAAALGLPIIGTKHGGIQEFIEHQKNGLLVQEKDPKSLADAMEELATEKEFAKKLGDEARNKVLAQNKLSDYMSNLKKQIESFLV